MLSVLVSSSEPVWRLVILTLAPATNAPLASDTAPAMLPSFSCACIDTNEPNSRHTTAGHLANCPKPFISPSLSRHWTGYSLKSCRQEVLSPTHGTESNLVFRVLYRSEERRVKK